MRTFVLSAAAGVDADVHGSLSYKPTQSIDTTHMNSSRCSSRRKLRGISFRKEEEKKS